VLDLGAMAARFHELAGWHVELYVDAAGLNAVRETLLQLPAACIDHLGLTRAGMPTLLALVERGLHVKATGFGRVDFPVEDALRAIHSANPGALLFGSDLPSTRAPRPFGETDIHRVADALGEAGARAVLCDNALAFYRVRPRTTPALNARTARPPFPCRGKRTPFITAPLSTSSMRTSTSGSMN